MTGFDIFDRYDAVMSLLVGGLMVGALALGAPLWAAVAIMFVGCVVISIRHFDELDGAVEAELRDRRGFNDPVERNSSQPPASRVHPPLRTHARERGRRDVHSAPAATGTSANRRGPREAADV